MSTSNPEPGTEPEMTGLEPVEDNEVGDPDEAAETYPAEEG